MGACSWESIPAADQAADSATETWAASGRASLSSSIDTTEPICGLMRRKRRQRISPELHPRLHQRRAPPPRRHRAQKHQRIDLRGEVGKQALRKADIVVAGGVERAGVQEPSLRSNVSVWLGAPAIRMKMTFLAVPRVADRGPGDGLHRARGQQEISAHRRTDVAEEHAPPELRLLPERHALRQVAVAAHTDSQFRIDLSWRSPLIAEQKVELVDHHPRQILHGVVAERGGGGFGFRKLAGAFGARNRWGSARGR